MWSCLYVSKNSECRSVVSDVLVDAWVHKGCRTSQKSPCTIANHLNEDHTKHDVPSSWALIILAFDLVSTSTMIGYKISNFDLNLYMCVKRLQKCTTANRLFIFRHNVSSLLYKLCYFTCSSKYITIHTSRLLQKLSSYCLKVTLIKYNGAVSKMNQQVCWHLFL